MKFCPECGESVKLEELYPEFGESNLTLYGCEKCNIIWECHAEFPRLMSRTKYYNKHTSRTLFEWRKDKRVVGTHECGSRIIDMGNGANLCERCDGV